MSVKCLCVALSMVLVTFAVGCGETRCKITGKVTFPDGTPLKMGNVRGVADTGRHLMSKVNEDGSFEFYETQPGDKVPAGHVYKIYFAGVEESDNAPPIRLAPGQMPPPPVMKPPVLLVNEKFTIPNQSGLVLDVPKSSKPIEYNITVEK
ncbi:MAG: hypothetical protein ACRC46_15430 [Thermoguttaceae bacterium]